MKLTRPDISNAVRELSKFMGEAGREHQKAMFRIMDYVHETKDYGVILTRSENKVLKVTAYVDSNYASDWDTRKSVTGYVVYINGNIVAWKSKSQKCVTLSSTEAEYVALSQCVSEVIYVKQVLESIMMVVELPIKIYKDNTGAIDLANNCSFHVIGKKIEQGCILVEHVRSEENTADTFTKNLGIKQFNYHTNKLIGNKAKGDFYGANEESTDFQDLD